MTNTTHRRHLNAAPRHHAPTARACIYTRVSDDSRSRRGRSVEEQEADARAECKRNGWDVSAVLCDNDIGASKFSRGDRPAWAEAKRMIAAGEIEVLVTWESSRAQRDLAAYVELRRLCIEGGIKWSYNGNTYDLADGEDAYRTGQDALDAEREAARTSKRVRRAVLADAVAGRPSGRIPFGYARTYDRQTGAIVEQHVDPLTGPIVVEMVRRILAGDSVRNITLDLNARGVVTGTGKRWSRSMVARLAVNPTYAALRVHRGVVIGPADWPALLTIDEHEAVTALLSAPERRNHRDSRRAHLLSGHARCGVCGGGMYVKRSAKGIGRYACEQGRHATIDETALDAHVVSVLLARLTRRHDGLPDLTIEVPATVLNARAEIDRLRAVLDANEHEVIAGAMTSAYAAKMEAKIQAQITDLERLMRHVPLPTTVAEIARAKDPEAYWSEMTIEEQTSVVRALVSIAVHPTTRLGARNVDLGRVRIEWKA
jgi:DNA invertase Pin-like site-specific DNA recombinase